MDTMKGLKRTHYCGEVDGIGSTVVVGGYVQKIRDMGVEIVPVMLHEGPAPVPVRVYALHVTHYF